MGCGERGKNPGKNISPGYTHIYHLSCLPGCSCCNKYQNYNSCSTLNGAVVVEAVKSNEQKYFFSFILSFSPFTFTRLLCLLCGGGFTSPAQKCRKKEREHFHQSHSSSCYFFTFSSNFCSNKYTQTHWVCTIFYSLKTRFSLVTRLTFEKQIFHAPFYFSRRLQRRMLLCSRKCRGDGGDDDDDGSAMAVTHYYSSYGAKHSWEYLLIYKISWSRNGWSSCILCVYKFTCSVTIIICNSSTKTSTLEK